MKAAWDFLRYAGCVGGKKAYIGPRRAEINVTNKCNMNCIACWSFSPLLKGRNALPPTELEWTHLESLLRDLAKCGCEEVLFVGAGEPMIHPRIMDALETTKSLGMACYLTTNMSAVTEKRAEQMFKIGLDRIYVSLWAATPETYSLTHPNARENTFRNIYDRLCLFRDMKSRSRRRQPAIIIHNVIFNKNYHEVRAMVDYALEVGATALQFTVIYALPNATDALLMDDTMRKDVLAQLADVPAAVLEKPGIHGKGTFIYELDIFRARLTGGQAESGRYDAPLLDKLPCRIGWFYTAIRTNGDVIPCCKGMNLPMGNIRQQPFRDIWQSETYDEFRHNANSLPKSHPYFAPIDCYKMCDNIGMLSLIDRKMQKLRPVEKLTSGVIVPLLNALHIGGKPSR